jgi:hypothetical protein
MGKRAKRDEEVKNRSKRWEIEQGVLRNRVMSDEKQREERLETDQSMIRNRVSRQEKPNVEQ